MSYTTECVTRTTRAQTLTPSAPATGWLSRWKQRLSPARRWAPAVLAALGLLLVAAQLVVIHLRPEVAPSLGERALERHTYGLPQALATWRSPLYQMLVVVGGACLALVLSFFFVHRRGRYPDAFTRRLVTACGVLGAGLLGASHLMVTSTYGLGIGLSALRFELPLRVALLCFAVGGGALALGARSRRPGLLAVVGLLATVTLLLIPRSAGWVLYDTHRIVEMQKQVTPTALLEHDPRAVPGLRMLQSLAPREVAQRDLRRRSNDGRSLLSLPILKRQRAHMRLTLAWQRYRILAIGAVVLLGLPLLCLGLWGRGTHSWRLPLAGVSFMAVLGGLGLFSTHSNLAVWHHVVVGVTLLPATLLLMVQWAAHPTSSAGSEIG